MITKRDIKTLKDDEEIIQFFDRRKKIDNCLKEFKRVLQIAKGHNRYIGYVVNNKGKKLYM